MYRIDLKSNNKDASIIATFTVVLFGILIFIIPGLIINIFPQSSLASFFSKHTYYYYLFLPIIIYFIIIGLYYYSIKIDAYVLYITSFRTLSGLLKDKNYIEVPHNMLRKFAFFNRNFSINKTLMIKLEDDKGKKIIKRFNISFLSKREELRISNVLEKIIAKNS